VPHTILHLVNNELVKEEPREKESGKIDPSKKKGAEKRWMNKPYDN
jgi:hypothetical protein